MKFFNLILVFTLIIFSSCTGDNSPEGVLREFVNYRFSSNQTREGLEQRTTGPLFEKISTMDEVEFSKFINMENIRKGKLKISLAKCSESQCHITYLLSYDEKREGQDYFKVEMKKIAELRNEGPGWKIADVSNLKTFYDSKQEIQITP